MNSVDFAFNNWLLQLHDPPEQHVQQPASIGGAAAPRDESPKSVLAQVQLVMGFVRTAVSCML